MAIITEKEGDIFDAPLNSILLRMSTPTVIYGGGISSDKFPEACNAQGIWGSGVALQFKIKVRPSLLPG